MYFLNLRFADIRNWESIIRSLKIPFNLRNFKIVSANISKNKFFGDIYEEFLKNFTISQEDFNTILNYNAAEITHFNGENGVEEFIEKWKGHIR